MDSAIIATTITVSGSIIVAALSFFLTKRNERKLEWQKQKINHYNEMLSALSDLAIDGMDKDKANTKFASAVNTIALVAPQEVITALMEFHNYVKFSNKNQTEDGHNKLLKTLLLEIRKDIGLSENDNPYTFDFHLIGSRPK